MRDARWMVALAVSLPWLAADAQQVGRINLWLYDQPGTSATTYEIVGGRREPAGEGIVAEGERAFQIPRARTWLCDRRTRLFEADTLRADGSRKTVRFRVETPPCHDRLTLAVGQAAPGRLRVVVRDRWGLGDIRPLLCTGDACRRLSFGGRSEVAAIVPAGRRVALRLGRHRWTVAGELPRMLVTGDSTPQNADTALAERLRRSMRVVRDWRGGTSISHDPWRWTELAARQARRHRARVTVVSIGANEGYPMALRDGEKVVCCGPRWRAEYSRRAEVMMRAFARGGRSQVLWMLLPAPQQPEHRELTLLVNAAIRAAAENVPETRLVPVDEILSPGGVFRRRLQPGGPLVRARDGVHLTPAGGRLAAEAVVREMPARLRP